MAEMTIRTYSELSAIQTYEGRFDYLKLSGKVGAETFGRDRFLNQMLYSSSKWKSLRDKVIIRDNGFDMGLEGYEIAGKILIHHMNPITIEDIMSESAYVFNPEFLISVAYNTHNAIHYGDKSLLVPSSFVERKPGDTKLW